MGESGNYETEIKFATDSAGLELALDSPFLASATPFQTHKLRTIYFDTPSGDLGKKGVTLRIRECAQKQNVLCFKLNNASGDDPFRRTEVEVVSPDLQPDVSMFDRTTRDLLAQMIADRPLERQFEIRMSRRSALVKRKRSEVEVSLDDGCVMIGENSFPLTELELEQKSGDGADLYEFAIDLAEQLPLRLDFVSKSEKACRLRGGEKAVATKAGHVELRRKTTLDEAMAASISNALIHFVANWAALREGGDPESIHQMRVALRRMRSSLSIFKRYLRCAEFDFLVEEARHVASGLGPARAYHVLHEIAEHVSRANSGNSAEWETLLAALQDRRKTSHSDARELINDKRTTLFVLNVQRFLARRAWREALSGTNRHQFSMPLKDFAVHALKKLRVRVLKRGATLPSASDRDLHKLRIALKDLRYGSELFSKQFDYKRKCKSFNHTVSQLLALLGLHNDFASARHLLEQVPLPHGSDAARAARFFLGWLAYDDHQNMKKLARYWKKLIRREPFCE
jgi:triphosphatase